MTEFEKPPVSAPEPVLAHDALPAPYEAMLAGQQLHDTSPTVSSKPWLGVTSLSVGVVGAFLVIISSALAGEWAVLVAPALMLPVSVAAIVLGHLGLSNARKSKSAMGVSIAGMIVGYVLIAFFIVILVILGFLTLVIMNWSTGA